MALDPTKIPKGQSREVTPGRSANLKGIYKHEGSGKKLIALSVPAADAFVHQGFKYVGAAPANAGATVPVKTAASADPEKDALKKQLAEAKAAQKAAEQAAQKSADEAAASAAALEAANKEGNN